MQQVKRNQRVFELGERLSGTDRGDAEAPQGGFADGENAVELVGGVLAVVPQMCVWVRAAERSAVCVGDEVEVAFQGIGEDLLVVAGRLDRVRVTAG